MTSPEDWARRGRDARLARLALTPSELTDAVAGADATARARRPAEASWSAVEVVAHLRDVEESFLDRLRLIVAMDEPPLPRSDPNRWAAERQYRRHDAVAAAAAFARRREETLAFLRALPPAAWPRAGVHLDGRGRRTIDQFLTVMAWHDENHLDQLRRALRGRA